MDSIPEQTPAPRAKSPRLPALVLFLAVLLAFLPALKNDFLSYDDPEYVTDNVHVQHGLTVDGVKWAFAAHGANWHPVTWLSHLLDGQLFGLHPWGHHLTNIIFHAANATLVFLLFFRLTRLEWPAFFVALLFGLHPLRVESVAWVSERKDVLSGFFFLLTLLAYAQYVFTAKTPGGKSKLYYVFALVLFALGLMSKSMLVTLPCVVLLLDFWPLSRFNSVPLSKLIREKIPFFILAAVFSVVAYTAQAHGSAMNSSTPLGPRVANALVACCRYLGKIFWPVDLSPLYPSSPQLPIAAVIAAAVLLAGITIFAFILRRTQPALIIGWLWFLGMLVPVLGLVKIGEQSMADRYTYLPSLGITFALVWGICALIKNSRPATLAFSAAGAVAAVLCFFITQRQVAFWQTTETMFRRAVDTTHNNTLADVGLGLCLANRGQLDEAIRLYRHSLTVSPNYFESHYNLALALSEQGKLDDAIAEFRAAMVSRPGDPVAYIGLGAALARSGHRDDAIAQFRAAARMNSSDPLPHDDLAKLLSADEATLDEAIQEFEFAVKLEPADADRQSNLGSLLMRKSRFADALPHFQKSIEIAPASPDAHNNLGTALAMTGHLGDAIAEFQTALKLKPGHADATRNLARARAMKNSGAPPAK